MTLSTAVDWKGDLRAATYLPALAAAEDRFAIPTDLLARVAYQESHWRTDIVDCSLISPAGAVGLMQLEPRFFPGAGVSWMADINTAGAELARLHGVFKDWQLAIAAYDWGEGNVEKFIASERVLPPETMTYVAQVFTDVPMSGAILNV